MKKSLLITAYLFALSLGLKAQIASVRNNTVTQLLSGKSPSLKSYLFNYFEDSVVVKNRAYYLKKSRDQKTAAWVLLSGGSTLIAAGLLIGNRNNSSFEEAAIGFIMGTAGVAADIGSIPLFISARKNKTKAALTIGIQRVTPFVKKQAAVMSLNIPIR